MEGKESSNWSETVEDFLDQGDVDKAISRLESVVSELQTLTNPLQSDHLQLSSALFHLAKLYTAEGFSLKADEARSRALLFRDHSLSPPRDLKAAKKDLGKDRVALYDASASDVPLNEDGNCGKSSTLPEDGVPCKECPDDDWEAIADRAPEELLPLQGLPEVSKLSLENTKIQTPKRRGRGKFSYTTHGLYGDQQSNGFVDYSENEAVCNSSEGDTQERNLKYGTRHVLVLADFSPSTRTGDLEMLLENFKDRGFVIRWVNDTVALAVFRTPPIALEALNNIQCAFTVRVLNEDDMLLSSIPPRDLEPPRQRPKTSTRTAQRLIAQGMGIKLPSTNFGSRELRKQEEHRKNRIVSRQSMRDDAWGDDVS
ncbi:uncharacterized protein LOC131312446 isoform X1 [Rhododendron vialii]|uniref:uncharacterized protein LOC131312446 isoform X1 n=1 Tax=Rhododendron vialii TaxID=182163 RepID=UPI002660347F|nr:uncharacterized protein LOC131312446 isoform X1 [Rhododendron vialii]